MTGWIVLAVIVALVGTGAVLAWRNFRSWMKAHDYVFWFQE
jgi:hypothetical protein